MIFTGFSLVIIFLTYSSTFFFQNKISVRIKIVAIRALASRPTLTSSALATPALRAMSVKRVSAAAVTVLLLAVDYMLDTCNNDFEL